jgi:hypothetical protein
MTIHEVSGDSRLVYFDRKLIDWFLKEYYFNHCTWHKNLSEGTVLVHLSSTEELIAVLHPASPWVITPRQLKIPFPEE